MATKTFNGRIQHKYDNYQAWYDANPVLLSGEPCFISVPADSSVVEQEPAVLIKVGDGTTAWRDLPWISAKAADIADWAKAATKPTYAASEITGMADYISQYVEDTMGITTDTNTVYRILKVDDTTYKLQSKGAAEADTAWADVADSTLTIPEYDDTTLTESINDINEKIGTVPEGKTVVEMIEEAEGSVYTITKAADAGEYAAVYNLTKDGVITGESINIPKDMVVQSGSVVTLTDGEVTDVAAGTYIKLVLANSTNDTLYIPVDTLIEYVTSGSAADDMVVIAVSADHKVTATITDGKITLAKLEADVQAAIGKAHEHANATVLDGITAEKVAEWDTVGDKANDADLAAIAKSGNVDDLAQTADTYFIINCGTATTVID